MKREIFRSVALSRMSSPEQLDQLLRVTTSKGWIALLAIGLILATAVVWGFQGRLATKSAGKGVVIRTGNLLTVGTLNSGQVLNVSVKPGSIVKKGQLIATVAQPEFGEKIRVAEAQLADAEHQRTRENTIRSSGLNLELDSTEKQRANYEAQIKTLDDQIKTVNDQIPVNEELFSKGLVTRQQILTLRERKASLENTIDGLRVQISVLNSNQYKLKNSGQQFDADAGMRITDLQRNLRLLRSGLALSTNVYSPYSGQVVEIQSQAGSLVGPGTSILTLQPDVDQLEVVAYISAMKAKEVQPGMSAELTPTSVRAEEYGFMKGKILSVAEYPATDAAVMRVFQNDALAKSLASDGPSTELHIQLIPNKETPSGFQWSSKKGAPIRITPGTICSVQIITREQPPVTMVIPYLKGKTGLY